MKDAGLKVKVIEAIRKEIDGIVFNGPEDDGAAEYQGEMEYLIEAIENGGDIEEECSALCFPYKKRLGME